MHAKQFWNRVDELLYSKRTTMSELSKTTGINYGTIAAQRTRMNLPKADQIRTIASFLDVSVEYLLTGDNNDVVEEVKVVLEDPKMMELVKYLTDNPEKLDSILTLIRK